MSIALVVSIVVLASALAVFLVAVRRRWLAHVLQHGFLLTLLLALAGTGVGGACVLAIWGAGVGRDLLLGEMVDELRNVGGVIEAEIHFGTTILITESTYEVVRDDFECRPMPEAHLKGKLKNPQLYEVVSTRVGVPAG